MKISSQFVNGVSFPAATFISFDCVMSKNEWSSLMGSRLGGCPFTSWSWDKTTNLFVSTLLILLSDLRGLEWVRVLKRLTHTHTVTRIPRKYPWSCCVELSDLARVLALPSVIPPQGGALIKPDIHSIYKVRLTNNYSVYRLISLFLFFLFIHSTGNDRVNLYTRCVDMDGSSVMGGLFISK